MQQSSQPLVAAQLPLWGSRLIEASAGTGKTWTIAALYIRLVLGHGGPGQSYARALSPADILVMTFTRAATRELSERIRARLLAAAQCFRNPASTPADDVFMQTLLADAPDDAQRKQAAWRLSIAAQNMDDASIYTIDAWCQRVLREHAFDSGCLFDEELVAEETALLNSACQDYWREACYPLSPEVLEQQILAIWPTLDAFQKDIQHLIKQQHQPWPQPVGSLLDAYAHAQAARAQTLAQLRSTWQSRVAQMQDFVDSQNPPEDYGWHKTTFSIKNLSGWLALLRDWTQGHGPDILKLTETAWSRLCADGLLACRTDASAPTPALPAAFSEFASLRPALHALPEPTHAARLHAAASVAQRLQHLKTQAGTFGFADMLQRLDNALASDSGPSLRQRILAQYPVALIDEFQDTSPIQYRIFDRIYRTAAHDPAQALLLIGDPKQSIYGFRGADIYSYLQARQATAGRHYALTTNYRSTPALLGAVNHCFLQAQAQHPQGAFLFQSAEGNPLPYIQVQAQGRAERWVQGGTAQPAALTIAHDLTLHNGETVRRLFARRCAQQIVAWLADPHTGFARDDGPFERLRPRDIAVLVRNGQEANAMRHALQQRGVASVYLSDRDSVFQSDEARDMVHWLRGVAAPQDAALVRAALAVPTVGWSLAELGRLFADEAAFDAQAQRLRELQTIWHHQGVLAMLRQALHRFDLAARWLQQADAGERRLTNFLHLAELLQNASADLDGEHALIRWLQNQIAQTSHDSDEQIVRLESDADLVKVVTIHKSKGLEYPVVCLPFATSLREETRRNTRSIYLPNAQGERELLLQINDETLARAEHERLREDLRLLYVAMTRPRHVLWLGFAALKVGNARACQSHKSAAGYLLGGPEAHSAEAWQSVLANIAAASPHIALVDAAAVWDGQALRPLPRHDDDTALRAPALYRANFERHWAIASYSRLTRDLQAHAKGSLSLAHARQRADDEVPPAASDDTPPSTHQPPAGPSSAIWHSFKRGPITGNFLHEQLEWLARERFALAEGSTVNARLHERCQRAGYDSTQADALVDWLQAVAHTPLPGPGMALSGLVTLQAELEFWLPLQQLKTPAIDQLCTQYLLPGTARPPLQNSTLQGMLMGFVDLVFEHGGRYWVLDYKSNHLGHHDADYGPSALAQAMARYRYDVQAAVYLLALHRLLTSRLGAAYDPAQHLGGAVYLFLRGLHGPGQGACVISPPLEFLAQFDALL